MSAREEVTACEALKATGKWQCLYTKGSRRMVGFLLYRDAACRILLSEMLSFRWKRGTPCHYLYGISVS